MLAVLDHQIQLSHLHTPCIAVVSRATVPNLAMAWIYLVLVSCSRNGGIFHQRSIFPIDLAGAVWLAVETRLWDRVLELGRIESCESKSQGCRR